MIFADSGAFVARYLKRDQHHLQARVFWESLEEGTRCLTSSHVLDEVVTYLARHVAPRYAAEKARTILASPSIEVLRPTQREEWRALDLLEEYGHHGANFTDCLSFVLMRSRKIKDAFTFDEHFEIAGFRRRPGA